MLIVSDPCRRVRDLCHNYGLRPNAPGIQGDLQVSLDMEKTFDTVTRPLVLKAFDQLQFDIDIFRLVHSWLIPHKYCIPFQQLIGHVTARRGIKQGDIPAPPKSFVCSLCHERIGRKGLAGHLRNEHQVDKPEFFSFRPSRDMMPGRLGCAHCLSCFTIEAALKLHYQRATRPALLIEWVKDQHFGPITTVGGPDMASVETLSTQFTPNHAESKLDRAASPSVLLYGRLGLKVPEDAPVWHSNITHDLCVSMFADPPSLTLQETPRFGPEIRLRWFATFTPWLTSLHTLPQVQIEFAPPLRLLHVCTRVHPIFWAWTSVELAPVRIDRVHLNESVGLQVQLLQTYLFELEHVLAQDWFQWYLYQDLIDGPYERRGSIISRPDGCGFLALQMSAPQRGGNLIRSSTLLPRAEEALALIGFGLGRRCVSPDYACQIDFTAGGSIEPIALGPHIPALHPAWQEFDLSAIVAVVEDMARSEGARQSGPIPSTVDVSICLRRACESGGPASDRVK